jgi:hypothetical protein
VDKEYYFLAGIPRSGSTLLAAILNQHPKIYASPTSTLSAMLLNTVQFWCEQKSVIFSDNFAQQEEEMFGILTGMLQNKYAKNTKPVIIDKCRDWADPNAIEALNRILKTPPKIIGTVRDIPDCAASFLRMVYPNPSDKERDVFLKQSTFIEHIEDSYKKLYAGYTKYPQCLLLIDYKDLIENPQIELDKVHEFLGLDAHKYDFNNIDGSLVSENDEAIYGIKNLHLVKPKIQKTQGKSAKQLLGNYYYDYFDQPCFWSTEKVEKPASRLDLMREVGLCGDFATAKKLGQEVLAEQPQNHRAAFNFGWYTLRDGHLLDGMKYIDRGRIEKVFGNPNCITSMPKWDGKTKGTVLLFLEGGLGDQIYGARFIKDIAEKGCEVIVTCSHSLTPIIKQIQGVTAICNENAAENIHHDFYVQSMSAVIPLKLQYADIKGDAYIPRLETPKTKKIRIGLRWQGNPEFEHQQHRLFPSELLFNAVEGFDVEFISLQRDEGSEYRPKWVKEVCLDSWEDTQKAVSSCDLVISSCTSVAHLSAAMGVKTWVVVPVLPYYLWAKPGKKTEWYNSVSLYRQTKYGSWNDTFLNINKDLTEVLNNADYKNRILGKNSGRRSFTGLGLLSFGSSKGS